MLTRWYFDTSARKCTQFTYSGCMGNANNFESEYECNRNCYSWGDDTLSHQPSWLPDVCHYSASLPSQPERFFNREKSYIYLHVYCFQPHLASTVTSGPSQRCQGACGPGCRGTS